MSLSASPETMIRLAGIDDLPAVTGLYRRCTSLTASQHDDPARAVFHEAEDIHAILAERILDRCLLVAEKQGCLSAAAGIDLDRCCLSELLIPGETVKETLLESLVAATERLAVRFGLLQLSVAPRPATEHLFRALGFETSRVRAAPEPAAVGAAQPSMVRSLRRRQTAYGRRVRALGEAFGIPADYGQRHRLPLQPEATRLASIGFDIVGRDQRLRPRAARAWSRMQRAAMESGISLQAVSAWRSVSYQCQVLERKLAKGLNIEEILQVSAAPGFSEHHSGRAIDITTPGFATLEEEFEHSQAFRWMEQHARDFGFVLSFPRNNRHRLAYEPWHWRFDG